ncbi:MAG: S1/P1 nuclease [Sphingobacterium sp.]|uniref:S1/P1 nuclease n=1 Tax=Sphingobacterium sp. JB170 TaxID=1434842 RepID=UPI00097EB149|nr:S1/P1 nuclease [Sphingobacterium sp. JB170]SJN17527.1 Endonuclease [Sphingobacterium sp. JB170]
MRTILKLTLVCVLLFQFERTNAWGMTGHRVIAEIAEQHLSKKAKRNIEKLIGKQKLAYWANWGDFIKSDPDKRLSSTGAIHFVNTPGNLQFKDFKSAIESLTTPNVFNTYLSIKENAKQRNKDIKTQQEYLYFIIHLIGDAHQPMHVSRAEDLGGNKIEVEFFGKKDNIHRVWDSGLVDYEGYSFTEYAEVLDIYPDAYYKRYTSTNYMQWLYEAHQLANEIYADVALNNNLRYEYIYKNKYKMEECLLKAGVRLAKELNEIYG